MTTTEYQEQLHVPENLGDVSPEATEPTRRVLGKATLSDVEYDQIVWPCGD